MATSITSRSDLHEWLDGRSGDISRAIAIRCALRVLPLALMGANGSTSGWRKADTLSEFLLTAFRAAHVSWAYLEYPTSPTPRREISSAATDAATAMNQLLFESYRDSFFVKSAAGHAFFSIAEAIASCSGAAQSAAVAAQGAAGRAAEAAASAAEIAAADTTLSGRAPHEATYFWNSVERDCNWTDSNGADLIGQPLWLSNTSSSRKSSADPPTWALEALRDFAESSTAKDTSFGLLVDWYHAILRRGRNVAPRSPLGPESDVLIATLPEKFWKIEYSLNAFTIMDEVAAIAGWPRTEGAMESELRAAVSAALETVEPQPLAAFRFQAVDDSRIAAAPPSDVSTDPSMAQDFLDEATRKARELQERLERSNADRRVTKSIAGLLDVLPTRIADLRPGLVRSRARSVEADAHAFSATSDADQVLFPEAVAMLLDLSETLRDLQGCFPQLRSLEAEILALNLDPSRLEQTKDKLDQIVDAASRAEGTVDQSAVYALQTMEAIASEDAPVSVRQKRVAEYALVVRNFASTAARFALDNAFTREAKKLGSDVYMAARPKLVEGIADGVGSVAKPAAIVAIASLIGLMVHPAAGLATLLAGFGKVDRLISLAEKWVNKEGERGDGPGGGASGAGDTG